MILLNQIECGFTILYELAQATGGRRKYAELVQMGDRDIIQFLQILSKLIGAGILLLEEGNDGYISFGWPMNRISYSDAWRALIKTINSHVKADIMKLRSVEIMKRSIVHSLLN